MRSVQYAFELHSFHMSDCLGMTGTCQIKLNDVLTNITLEQLRDVIVNIAFMTSKTLRVAKKPRRKQLNVKCAVAKMPLFFLLKSRMVQALTKIYIQSPVPSLRLHTIVKRCRDG